MKYTIFLQNLNKKQSARFYCATVNKLGIGHPICNDRSSISVRWGQRAQIMEIKLSFMTDLASHSALRNLYRVIDGYSSYSWLTLSGRLSSTPNQQFNYNCC